MRLMVLAILFIATVISLEACSYFQTTGNSDKRAQCQALRTRMMNYSMGQRYGSGTYTTNMTRQDAQSAKMHQDYDRLGCND